MSSSNYVAITSTGKRQSRFTDYESSTKRSSRKHVNYDGTPLSEAQIIVRELMALQKKRTSR